MQANSSETAPLVVGIGASAGGLAALRKFLEHVPENANLAFVVVVHLSPDHESHLAMLLQPHVRFPVQQVTETTALQPNHVYVIPPNANLNAIDTHLRLTKLEERRRERAPIDHFFRTLAQAHDGRSIAVVLTGTGSDGSLGVKDIKASGGLVVVQEPNEAEFDGMPQSAISTGVVDFILPLADIPATIVRYNETKPDVPTIEDKREATQDERILLQKIFAHLRARTERDFSRYKPSTVLRRITRRMQLNYIEDLGAYLDRLRERPEEVRALADDLLITITHFFRDAPVFEKLQRQIIPQFFAKKGAGDALRVWSVGCATGEEAYSLTMLMVEAAAQFNRRLAIQVFATDLHGAALAKAREGRYPGDIATDVSEERLRRFFESANGEYRIRKEIRDLVVFAPHNVLNDPPYSRMDLISCRNMMIYLERDVQQDLVDLFHYSLNPDGVLLLGSAESIETSELFRVADKKLCLFYKRNVPSREPRLPVFPLTRNRFGGELSPVTERPQTPAIAYGNLHQQLVEQFVSSSILVSPDNRIVHFSRAGRYMLHPDGAPTTNVLHMVREELQIELQRALMDAREKHEAIDTAPIAVRFNGHSGLVVLHVRPAPEGDRDGFALIVFEEQELPKIEPATAEDFPETSKIRIKELENERIIAQRQMQALIKDYEQSREEMRSSNEEMQSTNEELRSTMEELETSKEELQSINEELQTVNQQNRHKVEELGQLSSDLQNHLSATDIATLFLDRELRILRFTPRLGDLFPVRAIDQGRPITEVTNKLGYSELETDARAVLKHLVPVEREVQDQAGKWYLMRILPYRSSEDHIGGIVVTFIDIHRRKLAEDEVLKEKDFAETIIQTLHEPLVVLTSEFRVRMANSAFYSKFEVMPESISGQNIFDANNRQWDVPEVRQLLEHALPEKGSFQDVEIDHTFTNLGRRVLLVSAHRLDHLGGILLGVRDLTDKKRSEKELVKADRELRAANESLKRINADLMHFSYAVSHDMQEPLRMVTSFTQLLARDLPTLDPQNAQYIHYAVEGASRMETLLTALREYWSIDDEKLKGLTEVDCNAALQQALSYLQTVIDKTGAVITADHLPTILADEYALTLLFQNLIGNGIKYQPPGRTPRIHVSVARSAVEWRFSVTDNGIGIEPEQRELIFAPFKRLNGKQYPGSGLGLAMCRKIVETLRGRILVHSKVGEGSRFEFILPDAGGNI